MKEMLAHLEEQSHSQHTERSDWLAATGHYQQARNGIRQRFFFFYSFYSVAVIGSRSKEKQNLRGEVTNNSDRINMRTDRNKSLNSVFDRWLSDTQAAATLLRCDWRLTAAGTPCRPPTPPSSVTGG